MSDIYFSSVGSQTSRLPKVAIKSSDPTNFENWYPREKIPWTPELQMDLLNFFTKVDYPLRSQTEIPFREPLRSEIRRFFISLDAYIESPNPVIPWRDILYGATNKDYSKTLKRIKRKSFETTWMVQHFEYPDWWNDVPQYKINDIGDIFNYSYLIFWEGESDDYLQGFEPVSIDPEFATLFRESIEKLLPLEGSFNKIDPIEVLSQLSSSMSLDKSLKTRPHFLIKDKYLYFSKKRGACKRSVISVSPENYRDTVINCPSDLNTISLIDKQLLEILRVMPGHIHLSNKEEVTRRLTSFRNKYHFFIQRDLKKEGITKPRELLKIMLEVLHDKYPEIKIFQYTDFYENYQLILEDGSIVFPTRGHGLGMANALTTLMQLAVHDMIVNELRPMYPDIQSKCLCINDDFVAGFKDSELVSEYWNMEDEIMDKLSIIREPTKSFCSDWCFVLAERYFYAGAEYEKVSYQLRELLLPLTCYNVTHAKEYFISAQTYCSSKFALRYLDEIRNYWGYEFYPSEFSYPYIVGGWINEKINSVDLSLVLLEELDIKSYIYRGFKATNISPRKVYKGTIKPSPLYTLLGEPNIPKEYYEHFDLLSEKSLAEKYGKLLSYSRDHFRSYWNRYYKLRQKAFKKPFEITFKELLLEIKKSHPTTQFYPSDIMIKQYHECSIIQGKVDDYYLDPNPHLALISYYNDTSYSFKDRFSIMFTNIDSTTKKSSSLFSKEVQRALKSDEISAISTGIFHELYYPCDDYHPEEQYLNPIKIGEVTSILNWGKGYPEVFEEFQDVLINEKKEIFGLLFSLKDLMILTKYKVPRDKVLLILDLARFRDEDLETTIEYILENMPEEEITYFEPECESDSEDEDLGLTSGRDLPEGIEGYVTFDDLLSPGCSILWTVRHCFQAYLYESPIIRNYLGELDRLIIIGTFPGLYTPEQRVFEYEKIRSGTDRLLSHLVDTSGVSKLLIESNDGEEEDMSDAFSLFDDG